MDRYHYFAVFVVYFCSIGTQDVVIQIIKSEGYIAELHSITTADSYILNIHRIRAPRPASKVALVIHGLQVNSFAFVYARSPHSLAFELSNNGYDVWLGNVRGTEFCRKHQILPTNSPEFWDFSFHEIALYDLPAIIDNILTSTNRSALHYIGNSQAATVIMALLALKPQYNEKILTMHLMTPVIFLKNLLPWFRSLTPLVDVFEETFDATSISREAFTVDDDTRKVLASMCNMRSSITYIICKKYLSLIAGQSTARWDDRLFINTTEFFQHIPNSISLKQILHYIQLYKDSKGRFSQFDYRRSKNLLLYNQTEPPEYNLKNVRSKIHIIYGTSDNIAHFKDVERLIDVLKPFIIGVDKMVGWNHADFLIAKDLGVIYKKIMRLMKQYP